MKNILRKWLGINNLENQLNDIITIGKLVVNIEQHSAFIGEIKSARITRSLTDNGESEVDITFKGGDYLSKLLKCHWHKTYCSALQNLSEGNNLDDFYLNNPIIEINRKWL